jgi:hypothetical protein
VQHNSTEEALLRRIFDGAEEKKSSIQIKLLVIGPMGKPFFAHAVSHVHFHPPPLPSLSPLDIQIMGRSYHFSMY